MDNWLYPRIQRFFRSRRMRAFVRHFQPTAATRILDVGGTPFNWSLIPNVENTALPVTFLNVHKPGPRERGAPWVVADARFLPFREGSFDILYSNSVLEHLGNRAQQQAFAAESRRVGRSYYVQTPYRWFPIEPHLLTPLIHWLPRAWQRPLLRYGTLWGWINRPSPERCDELWHEICLLDMRALQRLYPGVAIWRERIGGITKSIIAVHDANAHRPIKHEDAVS
ncbi:MAG: methyltransferase domain-containing protein [Chloroflexaceae bacterium]|nr:methyltransferase domain-containing protein [Chloroflexaceae bacterium]